MHGSWTVLEHVARIFPLLKITCVGSCFHTVSCVTRKHWPQVGEEAAEGEAAKALVVAEGVRVKGMADMSRKAPPGREQVDEEVDEEVDEAAGGVAVALTRQTKNTSPL